MPDCSALLLSWLLTPGNTLTFKRAVAVLLIQIVVKRILRSAVLLIGILFATPVSGINFGILLIFAVCVSLILTLGFQFA